VPILAQKKQHHEAYEFAHYCCINYSTDLSRRYPFNDVLDSTRTVMSRYSSSQQSESRSASSPHHAALFTKHIRGSGCQQAGHQRIRVPDNKTILVTWYPDALIFCLLILWYPNSLSDMKKYKSVCLSPGCRFEFLSFGINYYLVFRASDFGFILLHISLSLCLRFHVDTAHIYAIFHRAIGH